MKKFCISCGCERAEQDPHVPDPLGNRRTYLRSRLSDLDACIAVLTAERQSLQAESNSIVYPILSLPTELTIEVFKKCLPSDSLPTPSPSTAPLLLTQICRQWREIALDAPDLWCALNFVEDRSSVEMLKLWLSRAADLPLEYTLTCTEPPRAAAVVEASMLHAHHWQNVSFGLPLTHLPTLDIRHTSFPMLRKFTVRTSQWSSADVVTHTIVIGNAPLLRIAHTFTLPEVKIEAPWLQLTTLTLGHRVRLVECLSVLRQCEGLLKLVVTILPDTDSPAPLHATHIILPLLESFTCDGGDDSILDHLTLPRLARLGAALEDPNILPSFIRRSACALRFLSLAVHTIPAASLDLCLRAIPESVKELQLTDSSQDMWGAFCTVLRQTDVLPQMKHLVVHCYVRRERYDDFLDMLCARRVPPSGSVSLESFVLEGRGRHRIEDPLYRPTCSTLAELKALAAEGLKIKLRIKYGPHYDTGFIIDS